MFNHPEFRTYAICVVVLTLNLQILAAMTAAKRNKVKQFVNPEDGKVNFEGAKMVEGFEHPDVARVQRAHRNALENIPMFYAVGLLTLLAGVAPMPVKICMITFTAARLAHTVVYLNAGQPFRTIAYAISALSLVAMCVFSLLAVFAS